MGQAMPSTMWMLFPLKLKGFVYALEQSMVRCFRWQNLPCTDKEYTFKVNVCYKCHGNEFLYIAISSMKSIYLPCKGVWWLQLFLLNRSLANCELYHWLPAYSKPLEANVRNTEGSNDVCLGVNQAPHISKTCSDCNGPWVISNPTSCSKESNAALEKFAQDIVQLDLRVTEEQRPHSFSKQSLRMLTSEWTFFWISSLKLLFQPMSIILPWTLMERLTPLSWSPTSCP